MKRRLSSGEESPKNVLFKGSEFDYAADEDHVPFAEIDEDHELFGLVDDEEAYADLLATFGADEGLLAPMDTGTPVPSAKALMPPRPPSSADLLGLPTATPAAPKKKKTDVVGPPLWTNPYGADTFGLPTPSRPGASTKKPAAPPPLLQPRRTMQPVVGPTSHQSAAEIRKELKTHGKNKLTRPGPMKEPRRQRVDLQTHPKPKAALAKIKTEQDVELGGNNQRGWFPSLETKYALPDEADYGGQYSGRMLSYLSTVSAAALELDGIPPTEVQYGHAFNEDGDYELFASTNNLASQELLAQNLADPSAMTNRVARSDAESYRAGWDKITPQKPKDIASSAHDRNVKHAAKLLFFEELHQRREKKITEQLAAGGIDEAEAGRRRQDVALARKAYEAFATGNVTVAQSPSNKTEEKAEGKDFFDAAKQRLATARKSTADKKKEWNRTTVPNYKAKMKKKDEDAGTAPDPPNVVLGDVRHAEQNVTQAMHDRNRARVAKGDKPYTFAEIQGTMIRCFGCSVELGANTFDGPTEITGRMFGKQASVAHFCEGCQREQDGDRQTVTGAYPVVTPGSPGSPVPYPESDEDSD